VIDFDVKLVLRISVASGGKKVPVQIATREIRQGKELNYFGGNRID